jgi:hypothetical protein
MVSGQISHISHPKISINILLKSIIYHSFQNHDECVVSLQAVKITRLPGYTPDVDTLGTLVWARTPAGVWWPGEALDPYHMPPTRSIPQLAAAGEAFLSFRLRKRTQGTLEPQRERIACNITQAARSTTMRVIKSMLGAVSFTQSNTQYSMSHNHLGHGILEKGK